MVAGGFVCETSNFATGGAVEIGLPEYDRGGVLGINDEKYLGGYHDLVIESDATIQLQLNGALTPGFPLADRLSPRSVLVCELLLRIVAYMILNTLDFVARYSNISYLQACCLSSFLARQFPRLMQHWFCLLKKANMISASYQFDRLTKETLLEQYLQVLVSLYI